MDLDSASDYGQKHKDTAFRLTKGQKDPYRPRSQILRTSNANMAESKRQRKDITAGN